MTIPNHAPSHPTASCWEKIKRAKKNIKDLEVAIKAFIQPDDGSQPYRLVSNAHALEVVGDNPPLDFSVRAGEIVHHLRSSLDHLVWQLVEHNPTAPPQHKWSPGFPIFKTEKSFRDHVREKIDGISVSAAALIEKLQPWRTHPHAPDESPLSILRSLDNTDKHQGLNVVVAGIWFRNVYATDQPGTVSLGPPFFRVSKPFTRATSSGTEIVRTVEIENPNVDVHARFVPEIAFDQFGVRRYQPVIPSLHQLTEETIGTLIQFHGEFPA